MPDVNFSINGQITKGALSQSFAASSITADMATAGMISTTLALGTNTTSIGTTNIGVLGLCFARNLSSVTTHTVSFGRVVSNTLHETVRLKGGEAAVLRLAPGDYAAKGGTTNEATRLVLTIFED